MTGEISGADGVIVLAIGLIALAIPLWALVDAISRPSGAFAAARSSTWMWIGLIALFWMFTGIVGVVLAVVYLASIRPRVKAVMP
jgi:Protein of unknown function (DUF2516)